MPGAGKEISIGKVMGSNKRKNQKCIMFGCMLSAAHQGLRAMTGAARPHLVRGENRDVRNAPMDVSVCPLPVLAHQLCEPANPPLFLKDNGKKNYPTPTSTGAIYKHHTLTSEKCLYKCRGYYTLGDAGRTASSSLPEPYQQDPKVGQHGYRRQQNGMYETHLRGIFA
jgi:hypothetical protein